MLHREGAGIARATDRQGAIRRQNQIRVVAGNCDACASGGVVDERRGCSVGIGNDQIDSGFCCSNTIDKVNLVGQSGDNAGSVIGCFY